MNLLPSSIEEFRKRSYWNAFFRSRGDRAFEWYGSYSDYKAILDSLDLRVPAENKREKPREEKENGGVHGEAQAESSAGAEQENGEREKVEGSQKRGARILHVGCGNSELAAELVEDGYTSIVNVDFSPVVISSMRRRFRHLGPSLEWECLDVRGGALAKTFGTEAFDVVLDKGFLDAYISRDQDHASSSNCETSEEKTSKWDYREEAQVYLHSVLKVLKPGGVYILITLAQDYLAKELVRSLHAAPLANVKIYPLSHQSSAPSSPLPYLLAFTKRCFSASEESAPASRPVKGQAPLACTVVAKSLGTANETFAIWELPKRIVAINKWRFFQSAIHHYQPGSRSTVSVHRQKQGDDGAAYSIAVYDRVSQETVEEKKKKNGKKADKKRATLHQTAALLVPLGQECSWLYATPEGNEELACQAGVSRLLVVTAGVDNLHASASGRDGPCIGGQKASVFEAMKEELAPYLADLALPGGGDIPVLVVSEETSVHAELACVRSPFAGWVLVRDVDCEEDAESGAGEHSSCVLRQMIFSCNPQAVQSEVKVRLPAGDSQAPQSPEFLFCQSTCAYHLAIAAAFALLPDEALRWDSLAEQRPLTATLLGLGGGVLARLLSCLFGAYFDMRLVCVDLDPVVVQLATQFFGFQASPPAVSAVVDDALSFVGGLETSSQDVLIVDINNASSSSSLTCPSEAMLQQSVLETMQAKLKPGGLLLFNLLSRCPHTKAQILERLTALFPFVSAFSMPADVNELIVCGSTPASDVSTSEDLQSRLHILFSGVGESLSPSVSMEARKLAQDAASWVRWSSRWKRLSAGKREDPAA
ncbi:Spermine/spermidine synthase family protein,related [Neospora caninum Liverpool]|uniref:Spermine/spermidine synthase family protein,related n=1 Tax=Neospora caninum (strain Liverpool) TaxID=572307 RepID=F0VD39_NEOCL|nr:Spermine/spermidine synthase family protein,related [Neospora caninum Liverpool]CBZ51554.1 Spermine/spermidine synthase family protein,related [Neospora caninum Liverpool]CEL65505.1 TPA: Spermine/spermidine synthase family protein,related [Neospora caninum Liverpool]|eukprot:XP_003881587.1 Spermine/spermidine synthase family protein,related [Neospora caninum Liverpool]